jgi:hypothetical protein
MKTGILVAGDLIEAASTCVMLPLNPLVRIAGIAVGTIPEDSEHPDGHDDPEDCADGELMNAIAGVTISGQAVFGVGSQCGCTEQTHIYQRNPGTDPVKAILLDQVTVPGV